MNKGLTIASLLLTFTLASCGPDKEADTKSEKETKKTEQGNVILDPAMKALNKAKSVEQTLLDAEAERKKKIDEL